MFFGGYLVCGFLDPLHLLVFCLALDLYTFEVSFWRFVINYVSILKMQRIACSLSLFCAVDRKFRPTSEEVIISVLDCYSISGIMLKYVRYWVAVTPCLIPRVYLLINIWDFIKFFFKMASAMPHKVMR